ncbi:MAG: SIS domain-containing protein [Treponema sp.]|jgi:D-sedoheptulose 7-phosphate isomerase|nr:SIS domain-containing protein [Treponema sp.]
MNSGINAKWIETCRDELVERYPVLKPLSEDFCGAARLLAGAYAGGGKLLVCGNGGSAADADHIVGELMKSFAVPRPLPGALQQKIAQVEPETGGYIAGRLQRGYPAIALTQHSALISAYANDEDPSLVYAQQVAGYGMPGDVFLGISTSGNSRNVVFAALTAKALGLTVLGLTGEGGGKLRAYCDVCLAVPAKETYQVQELHLPVYHCLCLAVEKTLTPFNVQGAC